MSQSKIIKIGIFYDGNYFMAASKYYRHQHARKKWLSIGGLNAFIRQEIARNMQTEQHLCQIVDIHFFRGRYYAKDCDDTQLRRDRIFDDGLMQLGIATHYTPLRRIGDTRQEQGIDVWLALEAFELTLYKHFHAVVLITSDSDYVPLLQKLNTLGTRVTLIAWEFAYTHEQESEIGKYKQTRVSQRLVEEAAHTVMMHERINNAAPDDPLIDKLFT